MINGYAKAVINHIRTWASIPEAKKTAVKARIIELVGETRAEELCK